MRREPEHEQRGSPAVPGPGHPERELRAWLVRYLADRLRRPVGTIGADVPFATYGLDSVASMGLQGDIEEAFGLSIEPTAAWDHCTVEALARHLAAEAARLNIVVRRKQQ